MNQFFAQFSKTALAMAILIAGIAFIVISDPPKTACDAQINTFKKAIEGHLIKGTSKVKKRKYSLAAKFDLHKSNCILSNSPGGCFEWFKEASYVLDSLDTMTTECRKKVGCGRSGEKILFR